MFAGDQGWINCTWDFPGSKASLLRWQPQKERSIVFALPASFSYEVLVVRATHTRRGWSSSSAARLGGFPLVVKNTDIRCRLADRDAYAARPR
jgi:hypothetical protein